MIMNFVHRITGKMVRDCDTESAAEMAWESCPNADETVTHGAMDAEHARLLVTIQRDLEDQIEAVEEAVKETFGVKHSKVAGLARTLVERANLAETERARLRTEVRSLERKHAETIQLLEVRTITFHKIVAELREEIAEIRSRSYHQIEAA
ncbi:hypothetical protein [Streptomyces narbonensis]|uniref:hypothetical protein n=1 Tax=Streptomyces narbonensis TaxID=67333 RepID=UPI00340447AA